MNTATDTDDSRSSISPLDDLRDYVDNSWMQYSGSGGPMLLWNRIISDISTQDDLTRSDSPVAAPDEAHDMMMTPIRWYLRSIGSTTASAVPTEHGYSIPRADMPTFRIGTHALAGVNAVVGNAMMSTRWQDAVTNLAAATDVTAAFIGNIADRDEEGFDFLKNLIQNVRVYFDSLARNADPATAQQALHTITQVACNEDFRLNPMQMIELLSCGLSLAQWDDTRVLAYDAISDAIRTMNSTLSDHPNHRDSQSDGAGDGHGDDDATASEGDDQAFLEDSNADPVSVSPSQIHESFEQSLLFLEHDLLRISGDGHGADAFLKEHRDVEPMADTYAARLIAEERWKDLLDFSSTVLRDNPNQQLAMIPSQLAPYEWGSVREAALEALDRRPELCDVYRERIIEAYGREDTANVARLRAASGPDWANQVRRIVHDYADGRGRFARNMAYEQILVAERMGNEAWSYSLQFPKSRDKLAKTIALAKPDKARRIILGPIGLNGEYEGKLPSRLVAYRHIAKSLSKYASVFSKQEAHDIAQRLVARYPARRTLAAVLHDFLD